MTIIGKNDPQIDVGAVQDAVNASDEVILSGTFNFGLEDTGLHRRRTVTIPKGVTIKGELVHLRPLPKPGSTTPDPGEFSPPGRIIGGGEELRSGATFGDMHCGAFKVTNSHDNEPVVIQGITFSQWKGQAISATRTSGLEVVGCRFEKPVPGTSSVMSDIYQGFTTASAIFAADSDCRGRFVARDNVCEFGNYGDYGEELPWDEQFAACVQTNFTSITLEDNTITGHDDGIEVILNRGFFNTSHILIKGNRLNLSCVIADKDGWQGGNSAIACLNNGLAETEICDNEIHLIKGHDIGSTVALALSGVGFTVRNNKSYMDRLSANGKYPEVGFCLGDPKPLLPLSDLGASFSHSSISDNYFQGTALYGIFTFETVPMNPLNLSHGIVAARNSLGDLHALEKMLLLSQGTYENMFIGFPWTHQDLSSSGTNQVLPVIMRFVDPRRFPLRPPLVSG